MENNRQSPTKKEIEQRCIEALINEGEIFFSDAFNEGHTYFLDVEMEAKKVGIAAALINTTRVTENKDGKVASMPYLIAALGHAEKDNYLWQRFRFITALTEENVGIDRTGRFGKAGNPIVVELHGCGLLTQSRIIKAYEDGLTSSGAARYTQKELDNLLEGILQNGKYIQLYTLKDVEENNIKNLFGRYGIVLDYYLARNTPSGNCTKKQFMENPLTLARTGSLEYAEKYFERSKDHMGTVGNLHMLNQIDYHQPQGRFLLLGPDFLGINGNGRLDADGNFIAVGSCRTNSDK